MTNQDLQRARRMTKEDVVKILEHRIKTIGKCRSNIQMDPTEYAQYVLQCAITEVQAGGYPRPLGQDDGGELMTLKTSGLWCDLCKRPIFHDPYWYCSINGEMGHSCEECFNKVKSVSIKRKKLNK